MKYFFWERIVTNHYSGFLYACIIYEVISERKEFMKGVEEQYVKSEPNEITLKNGTVGVIRFAREEDAKQIIHKMEKMIRDENYLEEEPESLNDVEDERREIKRIKREGSLYAVVDVDGEIAGVLIFRRGALEMNYHVVNVRTWITEKYRGQGLGSKIMEYGIKWSKDQGVEKICLDVFSNNPIAIQFYEKYGFVVEGNRKKQYILRGDYVDEIFMSKFLGDKMNNRSTS